MLFVTNDNHESDRLEKTAALITQQKQEAATTDIDQLSSMPLSQLAMDDSGPPVVHYGMHMPGIPQGSLYPTLASLSSEERTLPEETQTLHDKLSKGLEKYLQDAKQC